MSSIIISVIIPAFNEEKYITRCLRSVLSQTIDRDKYEIIVIDDCSTDNTLKVLKPFINEIKLIKNSKNKGLPGSLNEGIKNAKGQFIIRVDSDDFVQNQYLYIMSLFLQLNNHLNAVACDYFLIDESQNIISHENCLDKPIGCAIMYRIEHLIEIGLYDESFLAREDEDIRFRFEKKYKITRLPIPLYKYFIHGENMTLDKKKMNRYKKLIQKKHG